jgi:hypothetical protein
MMLPRFRTLLPALLGVALLMAPARAADLTSSLKEGTPDLRSAGPMAFGPDGVLFVGDSQGAAIFAIDTGDRTPTPAGPFKIEAIDDKIAAMLGTEAKQILINSLSVNPASGRAYLSISRGTGPNATPVIVRTDNKGKIEEVPMRSVKFAKATLGNAATNPRQRADSITHVEYVKGTVYVAGLSNEEFSSKLRAIPFPFAEADKGASIEIYHGAHGRIETASPVRTFTAYDINGETNILAAYTCTPLVKIPVKELKPGEKVKGTTVAELGNMNRPLDMFVYQKDGKDFVLMANSARGVMKISTDNIDKIAGITSPIRGGGKAGLPYETVANLKGVQHLDRLGKGHALLLVKADSGQLNVQSIELP